jgi:hypothetical protein
VRPDYHHSIINLLHGIRRRFAPAAAGAPYAPLALPGGANRTLLLLVLDGLGADYLAKRPDSFLARHQITTLSSVFPSTTASAITSYLTGHAPQQHAITGWFTWFREIGCLTTVLPFTPRFGGPSLSEAGITPQQLIGTGPLFDTLPVPSDIVYPNAIIDSDYTRATTGSAARHGYDTLQEMFATLWRLASAPAPRYLFAYWSRLDALAHRYGIASTEVARHFDELDAACAQALPQLSAAGVDTLICADHGLIDTDPAHVIHLEEHPALQAMLTLPLCGEPRTAFCYVRPRQREAFETYVRKHLGHACTLYSSAQLIAENYFGLGAPHPELHARCGDYTLLMKGNYVIKDRLINERPFHQIGIHGGISRTEMAVPLIAFPAA